MEFQYPHDFNEINTDEWNALLASSSTNAPFLMQAYLKRWWDFKGGGEWPDGELLLISARQGGKLAGIAPFFTAKHNGIKKILLLGSIEISDYLDLIIDPGQAGAFINQLFDSLAGKYPDIHEMLLYNIPKTSPNLALMEASAGERGWKFASEPAYHTPVIHLAPDWETYLAGIDKKQRHEIRRKLRRAEESPESIGWYIAADKGKLAQEIEDFFNLMALDEKKKQFLTPLMREQMRSIITWADDNNLLQLSFFTVEGKKAAAYVCLDYGDRIWVYNSGFDPQFREFSPGWVLLAYLIQHAILNGKKAFDFMRGNEEYKYRFGAVDEFVMKAQISR